MAHILADFALELQTEIKLEADGSSRGTLLAEGSLGRGKDEASHTCVVSARLAPDSCRAQSLPKRG